MSRGGLEPPALCRGGLEPPAFCRGGLEPPAFCHDGLEPPAFCGCCCPDQKAEGFRVPLVSGSLPSRLLAQDTQRERAAPQDGRAAGRQELEVVESLD